MYIAKVGRVATLALLSFTVGCGGGSPGSTTPPNNNGSGGSSGGGSGGSGGGSGGSDGGMSPPVDFMGSLEPSPAYAGFVDAAHPAMFPIASDLSGTLTWMLSDQALAKLDPLSTPPVDIPGLQWKQLTVAKAGTGTITVGNGMMTETAMVTVTAYTLDQWTAGKTRWTTAPTGIIACTTCHDGAGGVDNTPAYTAFFSEADLGTIITNGVYPWGDPLRAPNHKFTVTDAEKAGLIAYLRTLAPRTPPKM
jgi:hypothetical protein